MRTAYQNYSIVVMNWLSERHSASASEQWSGENDLCVAFEDAEGVLPFYYNFST